MEHKVYKIFVEEDFNRLTKGIKVAQCMRTDGFIEPKEESEILSKLDDLCVSEKLFCSYCNTSFEDSTQQRQHYKLDWHRYNLKKKLADRKPVTEEAFLQLADLDDVSSISGSESESEEDADTDTSTSGSKVGGKKRAHTILASRHTKVFFENADGEILSIYRCLLHGKKDVPERDDSFVPLALKTVTSTKWAIVMLGGGHFAAGIFHGSEAVTHKTFHCYTVRKGQGGTQSSRDGRSGGGHPKSAGASLRRYNESALTQHVQDLLTAWASDLAACDLVFYRAAGHNAGVLFAGRSPPLSKSDPRLRTVPFPTRRATFSEVRRVQETLSSLEVYGSAEGFQNSFPQSPRKKVAKTEDGLAKQPSDPECVDGNAATDPELARIADGGTESPNARKNRSPRQNVDRAKARKSPVRPLPSVARSSSESVCDSDEDCAPPDDSFMTSEDVEVDLVEALQEFEDTVPGSDLNPRKRKVTKKGPKKKKIKERKMVDKRPEMVRLRNSLFTACCFGDINKLCSILSATNSLPCDSGSPASEDVKSSDDVSSAAGVADSQVSNVREEKCEISAEDLLHCLNESVNDQQNRLLHIAAQDGSGEIVRLLMEAGSDPGIKNKEGHPPYVLATDKETRNVFRRFLAEFPDRYDYSQSQIPSGLTDDLLKQQAERRRALKKTKRDKTKQKRKEEELKKAELTEKERFLQLTDREKRALAAERRLLSESSRGGGPVLVVARCFLCAVDISGRVPFEYDIHRFCSIDCLKAHRMKNRS